MYDPIRMNPDNQLRDDANAAVLARLAKIECNTAATKGGLTVFGIAVTISFVAYLVITFIGAAAIINIFSSILG